ncbi:MAG: hypothetical protein HYX63_04395 [Gammaproteobacteria bacterium]|nr:hypothetical protein [Gammaproteobacteria bacterium]
MFRNRSSVTIKHMVFTGIEAAALQITGNGSDEKVPPKHYITGTEISDNSFTNCGKDYVGWSGACVQIGHLRGGLVSGNIINEDQGGGIKQWAGGWFEGVKVSDNIINVPARDKSWGADISIELWNVGADCEVSNNVTNSWISIVRGESSGGIRSVKISGNKITIDPQLNNKEALELAGISDVEVTKNDIRGAKFGIGLWESVPGRGNARIAIHHNIIGGRLDGEGVRVNSGNQVTIDNNTLYDLSKGLGVFTSKLAIFGIRFVNNIVLDTEYGIVPIANGLPIYNMILSNNLFSNVRFPTEDWGKLKTIYKNAAAIIGEAGVMNLADGLKYKLSSDSPAIDRGMDVGYSYCGRAPEIGAVEVCTN